MRKEVRKAPLMEITRVKLKQKKETVKNLQRIDSLLPIVQKVVERRELNLMGESNSW